MIPAATPLLACAQPMKVMLLGPPGVGKTTVGKQLSDYYQIHHLSLVSVVEDQVKKMVSARRLTLSLTNR
jgi:adenylate kinase family enzyme